MARIRTYLLYRCVDGVEEPILDDDKETIDLMFHYRSLLRQRLGPRIAYEPVLKYVGSVGSMFVHFIPECPDEELPNCGPNTGTGNGITQFEYKGQLYRFGVDGAKTLASMNLAIKMHEIGACTPYLCPEPTCKNYCVALDEQLFMLPSYTYFLRYCPESPNYSPKELQEYMKTVDPYSIFIREKRANKLTRLPVFRSGFLTPGELLVELKGRNDVKGDAWINGRRWEISPAPPDASQLDMHLAQLSSLDSRYALRFTAEVKHMFDDITSDAALSQNLNEEEEEESDADSDSAYVESSLVAGLQQKDFNREVDIATALHYLLANVSDVQQIMEEVSRLDEVTDIEKRNEILERKRVITERAKEWYL